MIQRLYGYGESSATERPTARSTPRPAPSCSTAWRQALALIGEYATPARIDVTAGDNAHDIVIEASLLGPGAGEPARRFASLRARAARAGIPAKTELAPSGTRFTWHARVPPGTQDG